LSVDYFCLLRPIGLIEILDKSAILLVGNFRGRRPANWLMTTARVLKMFQ